MIKIVVASQNPVKIGATRKGFERMFPDVEMEVVGISVPSGVSDQPMTQAETLTGAQNRAIAAQEAHDSADYWVGIEGGLEETEAGMEVFAWIVVRSKALSGSARTATFMLPPPVIELIHQGLELGDADDQVFGVSNSKQAGGALGLLTRNVVDRTWLYVPAVILALVPLINRELYQ